MHLMSENELHILLIDDQDDLNQKLCDIISSYTTVSYKLDHHMELQKGLLHLQNKNTDVVLLGKNGSQRTVHTLSEVQKTKDHIPIIVLCDEDNEKLLRALNRQGAHHVIKRNDINRDQFSHSIAQAIGVCHFQNLNTNASLKKIYQNNKEQNQPSFPPPSEISFRQITDKSAEIILVVGADLTIYYANESTEKLFGCPPGQLVNKPLVFPITKLEAKDFLGRKKQLSLEFISFMSLSNEVMEVTIPFYQSQEKIMEMRVSPIDWKNTKAYLMTLHDITDIKRVAQLTAEIRESNQMEKLKDEFLSIVSHEMRTPLTIVKGAVCNLRDGIVGELTEAQNKVLDTTTRNVDRLARIINDLLDLSRLDSGKAKVRKKKLNLNALLEEVVQNFKNIAEEKSIPIEIDCSQSLPVVFADEDMIHQVLTNLIQNAIRYAKSKILIQGTFQAQKGKDKSQVVICIKDDGQGIPKDKIQLLFNKFEQVNRPAGGSGYKGTGLGLAICKQIMDLHQGQIWAESDEGQGAQFFFTLPPYQENDNFLVALDNHFSHADKAQSSLSFLLITLGNLKEIKQKANEQQMASLFNSISKEIRNKCLRRSDFIHFRRDTKEFIVILPDTRKDIAEKVVARIRKLTKDRFVLDHPSPTSVILNIGLAVYPDDARKPNDLMEKAYQDMT